MTELETIDRLMRSGDTHWFYLTRKWRKKRKKVLELDKYECQICKKHGRYSKATIVHHINHADEHPELALDIYASDGSRNLISVCKYCHETECHPERFKKYQYKKLRPFNEERWD